MFGWWLLIYAFVESDGMDLAVRRDPRYRCISSRGAFSNAYVVSRRIIWHVVRRRADDRRFIHRLAADSKSAPPFPNDHEDRSLSCLGCLSIGHRGGAARAILLVTSPDMRRMRVGGTSAASAAEIPRTPPLVLIQYCRAKPRAIPLDHGGDVIVGTAT